MRTLSPFRLLDHFSQPYSASMDGGGRHALCFEKSAASPMLTYRGQNAPPNSKDRRRAAWLVRAPYRSRRSASVQLPHDSRKCTKRPQGGSPGTREGSSDKDIAGNVEFTQVEPPGLYSPFPLRLWMFMTPSGSSVACRTVATAGMPVCRPYRLRRDLPILLPLLPPCHPGFRMRDPHNWQRFMVYPRRITATLDRKVAAASFPGPLRSQPEKGSKVILQSSPLFV